MMKSGGRNLKLQLESPLYLQLWNDFKGREALESRRLVNLRGDLTKQLT